MILEYEILESLNTLPENEHIIIYGGGETGQEFYLNLMASRKDIVVDCFIDSYKEGRLFDLDIKKPEYLESLKEIPLVIICSVFWNEILESLDLKEGTKCYILSNDVINSASHIGSFGSFYFEDDLDEIQNRFNNIVKSFRTEKDILIFNNLFDLRHKKKEKEFFSFSTKYLKDNKKEFIDNDKYSENLDFSKVDYAIEGGVYDGQDSLIFLNSLKKNPFFKKLYAFDPFLQALYNSSYYDKIDKNLSEFTETILWNKSEKVGFKVDETNPANSKIVEMKNIQNGDVISKVFDAVSIDDFLKAKGHGIDLIKLDVEGSEMDVLKGAYHAISEYKPKLAISIYHKKEDMIDIPEYILSIHKDYEFSISINNASFIDMVLYAY
jgi:FkbM family methyltransferase